jgi:hypothetical protein
MPISLGSRTPARILAASLSARRANSSVIRRSGQPFTSRLVPSASVNRKYQILPRFLNDAIPLTTLPDRHMKVKHFGKSVDHRQR